MTLEFGAFELAVLLEHDVDVPFANVDALEDALDVGILLNDRRDAIYDGLRLLERRARRHRDVGEREVAVLRREEGLWDHAEQEAAQQQGDETSPNHGEAVVGHARPAKPDHGPAPRRIVAVVEAANEAPDIADEDRQADEEQAHEDEAKQRADDGEGNAGRRVRIRRHELPRRIGGHQQGGDGQRNAEIDQPRRNALDLGPARVCL